MLSILKWIGIIVLVLVVALIVLGVIMAKVTAPPKLEVDLQAPSAGEDLDEYFTGINSGEKKRFNGIVLVRKGSETLLKKAYGIDGFERPMDADSSLRLGSVSKQFTAVGILTLVESGQIDLDTSGIPLNYMGMPKDPAVTNASVEDWVCGKDGKLKKAGKFKYSNTGYLLLARIIERVSGQSFENYMKAAVFTPLGMDQTRVWNQLAADEFPARAIGFKSNAKVIKPVELTHLDGVAGDGGVFSSLNDLENWAQFWTDDRLISDALKAEAMTGGEEDYGYGVIRQGDAIWHNGRWLAATAFLHVNIKNGDLVIVVDNGANFTADRIGQSIVRKLSP